MYMYTYFPMGNLYSFSIKTSLIVIRSNKCYVYNTLTQ